MTVFPLIFAGLLATTATNGVRRVLVFPLDASQVNPLRAQAADKQILAALKHQKNLEVIESGLMSRQTGIDLGKQAHACDRDVLCLVQLGTMVGAEHMLVGGLKEGPSSTDILRLSLIDVNKAALSDSIRWRVPVERQMIANAAAVGARQLLTPPDAILELELKPKNARLVVFGETLGQPPYPESIPYWSGTYLVRIDAVGHLPKDVRLKVKRKGRTKVQMKLDPDPLYVPPKESKVVEAPQQKIQKKEYRPSEGSTTVSAEVEDEGTPFPPPALLNPIGWALIGAGSLTVVAGALVMDRAQSDYNQLSQEPRYVPGITLPALQASEDRDSASSRFTLGSAVAVAGVATVAGGIIWMIIDAPDETKVDADAETGSQSVSCMLGMRGGACTIPW